MPRSSKTIVTCAVTGAIHTPSMSPYLPITAQEIAEQAIAAAKAGAAVIHLHARDPETGAPDQSPALYAEFLGRIKEECDAILNITTGGGLGMPMEARLAPALAFKPEVASMNMGSLNFNISGAASRISEFRHAWEKPYLEMTKDFILSNTFAQIERGMNEMGNYGTRFEFECYDASHLYNLAHFADRGVVKPPFFIQSIFGILGGIGSEGANLMHMRATALRLFGDDHMMSVLGAGKAQMRIATANALEGGHVRVGLEDSLYVGKGRIAISNAEQVEKIVRILGELDLEIATADEARAMLQTKGASEVNF